MNIDQKIDKWIDQQGITPGKWFFQECGEKNCWCGLVSSNAKDEDGDNLWVVSAGCCHRQDAVLVANSRKSLHGWIKTAWEMYPMRISGTQMIWNAYALASENIIASTGKEWSQVREELEQIKD